MADALYVIGMAIYSGTMADLKAGHFGIETMFGIEGIEKQDLSLMVYGINYQKHQFIS